MQLRNKITVATSSVGLLLLILGGSGAWHVLQLQRSGSAMLEVNVSSIRAAEEMELIVRETRHKLDRFLLTLDSRHLQKALEQESELSQWQEKARFISGSDNETALLAEIDRLLSTFFTQLYAVVDKPGEPTQIAMVEHLEEEVLTKQVLATAHKYLVHNEQELELSNQQSKAMAERLALALLLLGSCGAIAGLVVGYGLAHGISRSIFQLSVPIRDVAGKLNEIVGPVEISADPNLMELETILQTVAAKVATVVEQLHERHREVIRADQLAAVGQLAAGLAHEIRNPLMCMKTLVQSARRQGDSAQIDARDLAVLDEEISRLDNLLQTFLDFARPAKLEAQDVDLSNVVRQTVDLLTSRALTRNVTIETKLPVESLVVSGDSAQLRQVLLNLMLNSLEAVPNGGEIMVNCAALSETLLESELFGHERGSFTGADRRRIGKFEQVNGGTIFLDEIGDMTTATQSKVLRLLQEGTFERVGSNETVSVEVRVIAATNRRLEELVKEGEFREDLYYRLRVFTIELPALRERKDDIELLVEHFINLFNVDLDKNVRSIAPDATQMLLHHQWPGNVRELENAIKHALVRNKGDVLTLDSLPTSCLDPKHCDESLPLPLNLESIRQYVQMLLEDNESGVYQILHNEVDRILLPEVLDHVDGKQAVASEILGIARSTLRTKISDLGLAFEKRLKTDPKHDD